MQNNLNIFKKLIQRDGLKKDFGMNRWMERGKSSGTFLWTYVVAR